MSCNRLSALLLLAITVLAGACDPDSELEPSDTGDEQQPREPIDLLVADAWVAARAERDPVPEHRPEPLICPSSAWGLEFDALEVSTQECNYLSVTQPLAHPVAIGDPLRVTAWWQTLIAGEPADGHLALYVDGELLWEIHVAIPGPADVHRTVIASPIAAPAGAEVIFHLHNHGYNSWTFAGVELLDPAQDYELDSSDDQDEHDDHDH